MARINLREYFPEYEVDCYIDIADNDADVFMANMTKEITAVYIETQRAENAFIRRMYYHKAHYSLDAGDGIETGAVYRAPSSEDKHTEKLTREQLASALTVLPEKQRARVYRRYVLGMSNVDIAREEGVHESTVRESISLGVNKLKKYLKNIF